jgi:cellulose biosynthesis protein BcsQ
VDSGSLARPYRLIQQLGKGVAADYAFVDLGPNVGALNRAVLLGSDYLIVPLAADLFSLRALPSVGGSIQRWVREWETARRVTDPSSLPFAIPNGLPKVLGYVSQQFNIYGGGATKAFSNWIAQMPNAFETGLLGPLTQFSDGTGATLADPAKSESAELGELKNYHSLVPHAQTMRRAIFELEVDTVIWGDQHKRALRSEADFRALCNHILSRTGQQARIPESIG